MITFIHAVGTRIASAFARGLHLLSCLHDSMIEARTQRAMLEAERLRGRYLPSSRNEDDLPIVR